MNEQEADEHINLSRDTLTRYRAMIDAGRVPVADLPMIEAELQILSDIASEHPLKGDALIELVVGWVRLRERLKAMLH